MWTGVGLKHKSKTDREIVKTNQFFFCFLKMEFGSVLRASLEAQMVKNLPTMQETQVQSPGREDPLEKGMATHSSILAWESHGRRSLGGYRPWRHEQWDMTERLAEHKCIKQQE